MRTFACLIPLVACLAGLSFAKTRYASHPPMRPLPEPSDIPARKNPTFYVDSSRGNDANPGTKAKPWKSINHGLRRLKPGDALHLRGGTYYENVVIPVSGTEEAEIVIRSHPGELATIDAGLREFHDSPEDSWKPFEGGAKGEFVSTRTYPQFNGRPIVHAFPAAGWEPFFGKEDVRAVALGHFADSMVPLHGYRQVEDLRDDSMLWDVSSKFDKAAGVYCGPGLWFNRKTERIHVRLAHTTLAGLGDRHYRGETDPRKLALCVSGPYGADALRINGVSNVVLRDIEVRGASGSPLVNLYGSENVTLDGLTLHGGSPGLLAKASSKVRIVNCAFRGLAAPWSSRASMKYRGTPSYRLITQRNKPLNKDWEISHCEFTDDHDGIWIRYVDGLNFHHNYFDHFNDDGIEVGARKRDHLLHIHQNLISRCALTLTLHEMEVDEGAHEVDEGRGVFVMRNVIDLRGGILKYLPKEEDPSGAYMKSPGALAGDHGSPIWPDYHFYHNTVIRPNGAWRGYYGHGIGGRGTRGNRRSLLNNCFVQLEGLPGLNFSSVPEGYEIDGNLHWGLLDGPSYKGDFFKQMGRRMAFRKMPYPERWMRNDVFADPKFRKLTSGWEDDFDLSLNRGSPAENMGVKVPEKWPDPLRASDPGRPDLGAMPMGTKPWRVGIRGRLDLNGKQVD